MRKRHESCFYKDKQGIKGLAAPFPCTPNPRKPSLRIAAENPQHTNLT